MKQALALIIVGLLSFYVGFKVADEKVFKLENEITDLKQNEKSQQEKIAKLETLVINKDKTIKEQQKIIDGTSTEELLKRAEEHSSKWFQEKYLEFKDKLDLTEDKKKKIEDALKHGKKKMDSLIEKYFKYRKENPNATVEQFMEKMEKEGQL